MNFLRLITQSIYSPEFYRKVMHERFSFSLRYFISLLLVLAVVLSIPLTVQLLPVARDAIGLTTSSILQAMPDDLVITLKEGKVTINKEEPFFIKMPQELRTSWEDALRKYNVLPEGESLPLENLLVIDTQNDFSDERFRSHNTHFMLTRDSFVAGAEELKIYPLNEIPDQSLDKAKVAEIASKTTSLGRWLAPMVVFGSFIVALFIMALSFVYLLLGAFVVWAVAWARNVRITYKTAYQVGLHAVTLSLIFYALSVAFSGGVLEKSVPPLMIVLLAVVTWFNIAPEDPAAEGYGQSGPAPSA